jgi:hypothetical protein
MLIERGVIALNALRRAGDLDSPELVAIYQQHQELVGTPIAAIIQEGVDSGQFRPVDPEMAVISLLGMINIYLARRMLIKLGLVDVDELEHDVISQTMDLFLHGICQPTSTPARQAEEDGVIS